MLPACRWTRPGAALGGLGGDKEPSGRHGRGLAYTGRVLAVGVMILVIVLEHGSGRPGDDLYQVVTAVVAGLHLDRYAQSLTVARLRDPSPGSGRAS